MTQDFNVLGDDLFGEPIRQNMGVVAEKFLMPPFTTLDARSGQWQDRKRAWASLGIKGEIGRDAKSYNIDSWLGDAGESSRGSDNGVSIFDPVVCELMYKWFSPKGGQILDPFAGGSVRGVVAALLGFRYWGSDLRTEQIAANEAQADEILGATIPVKVSAAMLRQPFHPCSTEYIRDTCQGRCCDSPDGAKVAIHPSEANRFAEKGATVVENFIQPDERGKCPFKTDEGFCGVHDAKPFGCAASPFTLNENGTLIVRNRFRRMICYKGDGAIPAYKAHPVSLRRMFGDVEAQRIIDHLDAGGDDIVGDMPAANWAVLVDNDRARGSKVPDPPEHHRPIWVAGDSMATLETAPEADFVFSCPPYGDLEKYSTDPRDLSSMEWHTFAAAYRRIILRSLKRLRNDRFACFVVANFRGPDGSYRDLVGETVRGFEECGAKFYNDAILSTPVGTACMRVTGQFEVGRKFAKTHQNILVFVKGDWRKAAAAAIGAS